MKQMPTEHAHLGVEWEAARGTDEDELVRAWREEQLVGLGVLPALARAFADLVDWHEVATLVHRGCPPTLALTIVR